MFRSLEHLPLELTELVLHLQGGLTPGSSLFPKLPESSRTLQPSLEKNHHIAQSNVSNAAARTLRNDDLT